MIKPFQFARIPKIYFKSGIISELPEIVRLYGGKIILVTGKHSFINSTHAERLFRDLESLHIGYEKIVIPGEPSPEIIDQTVGKFKSMEVNLVIGIGGGSVLDAGKAISAMINKPESVMEFLEVVGTKDHPGTKIPFIAVPTTSGTGSEATKNAVISQTGINGFKRSLRHDNLVPDIALIDPELTLQCPKDITAASGMDCFTQLTEAYLSTKSNEYTDALAIEGLREIKSSLVRSYFDGDDIEARTGISFAALTSGICLANAGLGVVHGFASSVGGRYNIPHGIVCGTLMAKANEINVRELRRKSINSEALTKYALLGGLFLDEKGKTQDYYIDGFIGYLHKLTDNLHLPGLRKHGLNENDIENICLNTENKNNPVMLGSEELIEILKGRFL
jgi:alcohol dehydrogenase class IV